MLGLSDREFEMVYICDKVRVINTITLDDFFYLFFIPHGVFMVIVGVGLEFAGLGIGGAAFELFDPFFDTNLLIRLWTLSKL